MTLSTLLVQTKVREFLKTIFFLFECIVFFENYSRIEGRTLGTHLFTGCRTVGPGLVDCVPRFRCSQKLNTIIIFLYLPAHHQRQLLSSLSSSKFKHSEPPQTGKVWFWFPAQECVPAKPQDSNVAENREVPLSAVEYLELLTIVEESVRWCSRS